MVMTTMVIIIPPTIAAVVARGISTIDEVFPGRPRGRWTPRRGVGAWERARASANYSVFYGQ